MITLHFEKQPKKAVSHTFQRGKYADLWSIVHINTGLMLGIVAVFLHLPLPSTAIVIFIILTLYEGFEMYTNTIESITNSASDIIIAFIAFLVSYYTFLTLQVSNSGLIIAFTLLAFISITLDYLGWRSYLRKRLHEKREFIVVTLSNRKVFWLVSIAALLLIATLIIL